MRVERRGDRGIGIEEEGLAAGSEQPRGIDAQMVGRIDERDVQIVIGDALECPVPLRS